MSRRLETIVELFNKSNKETAQSWITNSMMRFVNNWRVSSLITLINPMHTVIAGIIDEDSFFEVHKNYAEKI
jgi:acetyl-CoA carboxylase carboxyltransferase component